jgi:hypothetical protein
MHSSGTICTNFRQAAKGNAVVAARNLLAAVIYRVYKENGRQTDKSTALKANFCLR